MSASGEQRNVTSFATSSGETSLPAGVADRLRELDHGRPRPRVIHSDAAPRQTDRQLSARMRTLRGETPQRRQVGVAGTLAS